MEQSKKDISLFDILFKIFNHKILLICVTLIVALLSCWFCGVFSNQDKTIYNVSFYVSYPDTENLQLPDGTLFVYTEVISEEAIDHVYNSSADFAKVNIDELLKSITIDYTVDQASRLKTQTKYIIMYKQL